MRTAREVVHEVLRDGLSECMPVEDEDGDLVFTSHGPRCELLTAAIEARDVEHARDAAVRERALREALEAIRDQRDWTAPDGARMRHPQLIADSALAAAPAVPVGLDAATVEACARHVEGPACAGPCDHPRCRALVTAAKDIRSLTDTEKKGGTR